MKVVLCLALVCVILAINCEAGVVRRSSERELDDLISSHRDGQTGNRRSNGLTIFGYDNTRNTNRRLDGLTNSWDNDARDANRRLDGLVNSWDNDARKANRRLDEATRDW